jgi:hypothetical protein
MAAVVVVASGLSSPQENPALAKRVFPQTKCVFQERLL